MKPFQGVKVLDDLANEFFREFSRAEYCLKAVGLCVTNKREAQPDWTAFSDTVRNALEQPVDADLIAAITYFNGSPPKKQVYAGGQLKWDPVAPGGKHAADDILILVRRVRNNLFHGGKFNGHWFEPERSERLLSASLAILRASIDANSQTKQAYAHRAP
jgi:hypothetical protein